MLSPTLFLSNYDEKGNYYREITSSQLVIKPESEGGCHLRAYIGRTEVATVEVLP